MIDIGAEAPDFELTAHTGETIRLHDVLERSQAVIFFYGRDATPG